MFKQGMWRKVTFTFPGGTQVTAPPGWRLLLWGLRARRRANPNPIPSRLHPDANKPVPWGQHPYGCDCGDCP